MQYKGVYACGHEGTVRISGGKASDREWKANRAFEHDCPECQKKVREEEIRVINEESASDSKKLRFPELEGSPKQIAWANTIRLKFYDFCVDRDTPETIECPPASCTRMCGSGFPLAAGKAATPGIFPALQTSFHTGLCSALRWSCRVTSVLV